MFSASDFSLIESTATAIHELLHLDDQLLITCCDSSFDGETGLHYRNPK
jgi:hypothetical protein